MRENNPMNPTPCGGNRTQGKPLVSSVKRLPRLREGIHCHAKGGSKYRAKLYSGADATAATEEALQRLRHERAGRVNTLLVDCMNQKGVILQKGTEPTGQIPKPEAKGRKKKDQGLLCVMERNHQHQGNPQENRAPVAKTKKPVIITSKGTHPPAWWRDKPVPITRS